MHPAGMGDSLQVEPVLFRQNELPHIHDDGLVPKVERPASYDGAILRLIQVQLGPKNDNREDQRKAKSPQDWTDSSAIRSHQVERP